MEELHSGDRQPEREGWASWSETALLVFAMPALADEVA